MHCLPLNVKFSNQPLLMHEKNLTCEFSLASLASFTNWINNLIIFLYVLGLIFLHFDELNSFNFITVNYTIRFLSLYYPLLPSILNLSIFFFKLVLQIYIFSPLVMSFVIVIPPLDPFDRYSWFHGHLPNWYTKLFGDFNVCLSNLSNQSLYHDHSMHSFIICVMICPLYRFSC